MPSRFMTVKCAVPDVLVEEGDFTRELVSRNEEGDQVFEFEVQRVTQQDLKSYVESVNYATRAAYAFCKYIFLGIVVDNQVQINALVDRIFFKQVWPSLTSARSSGRAQAETVRYRDLIGRFKADFMDLTQINLTAFRCPDQQATYSSTRIEASYLNNVEFHFGNRLRQVINRILDLKAVKAAATKRLLTLNCYCCLNTKSI